MTKNLESQLEFSFMWDVNLQCYNKAQKRIMEDIYFGSTDYFLNPHPQKKPSSEWIEMYFKSEYAIHKAKQLREIYFPDLPIMPHDHD